MLNAPSTAKPALPAAAPLAPGAPGANKKIDVSAKIRILKPRKYILAGANEEIPDVLRRSQGLIDRMNVIILPLVDIVEHDGVIRMGFGDLPCSVYFIPWSTKIMLIAGSYVQNKKPVLLSTGGKSFGFTPVLLSLLELLSEQAASIQVVT